MNIEFVIATPQTQFREAAEVITKFGKINKLNSNVSIIIDYNLIDDDKSLLRGVYYPDRINKIYVNPDACDDIKDVATSPKKFYYRYTNDPTIFGVTIHEFCHYLVEIEYPCILQGFKHDFPKDRLYLNYYSDYTVEDEMVEAMTLYIVNPFLLKLISYKHWKFFKGFFKPTTACTTKEFLKIYNDYPQEVKIDLKDKWNIEYNIDNNKFERGDIKWMKKN